MRRSRAGALVIGACCSLWLAACRAQPAGEAWPDGTLLLGRTEALGRLLGQLAGLQDTPLARLARRALAELPGCKLVSGRAREGGLPAVVSRLRCLETPGDLAILDRARGQHDLALALPLSDGARGVVTVSVHPGGDVEAELSLPEDSLAGFARMLLPGADAPGAPLLSGREQLSHVRLRPDSGLDVSSLVPAGSQGEQLFRLKSELFAGAVLDGTWEAALYLPEPGRPMPRAALALGFRSRAAAVTAIERLVSDLEADWSLHRTDFRLGSASGACLLELRLLPDLSPCYVATDRALVLGWNPSSLRRALDGAPAELDAERGGAVVELTRFREADARLARALGGPEARQLSAWPWSRILADGLTQDGVVRIRVQLLEGSGA